MVIRTSLSCLKQQQQPQQQQPQQQQQQQQRTASTTGTSIETSTETTTSTQHQQHHNSNNKRAPSCECWASLPAIQQQQPEVPKDLGLSMLLNSHFKTDSVDVREDTIMCGFSRSTDNSRHFHAACSSPTFRPCLVCSAEHSPCICVGDHG